VCPCAFVPITLLITISYDLNIILMGPIKVYPSLYYYSLSIWVIPLCWVAMVSCYIWVMVVLMNINVIFALLLCYVSGYGCVLAN
jgi:hypothetical protein